MNTYSMLVIRGAVLCAMVVLVVFSAPSTKAQSSARGVTDRDRNLRDRDLNISLLERSSAGAPKREPRLLLQEINEDFARLQVVNNEMKTKGATDVVLDFKYVSEAAAEIRKRSSRLRTNLAFPESAKADKREKTTVAPGLLAQLATLDRLIKSFVTNPVFTDANVINAELAAKARGDLDQIIELSDTIKKNAAKLNKAKADSH